MLVQTLLVSITEEQPAAMQPEEEVEEEEEDVMKKVKIMEFNLLKALKTVTLISNITLKKIIDLPETM
jgi:translation initiation factor 1 (eIF-1/SUI1)